MAKKISQLDLAGTLDGTELSEVVQASASKRAPLSAYPISDATQAALDLKAPLDAAQTTGNWVFTGLVYIESNHLRLGPTAFPASYEVFAGSAYLTLDKLTEEDDCSVVYRQGGDIKWEVGATTELPTDSSRFHFKRVTGSAGSETFTDVLIIDYDTGDTYVVDGFKFGVGTLPVELFHVADTRTAARVVSKFENFNNTGSGSKSSALQFAAPSTSWVLGNDFGLNGNHNWFLQDETNGAIRIFADGTGVSINGSTIAATEMFRVDGTTGGILPPRLTTVQRDALGGKNAGLFLFNSNTTTLQMWNGSAWRDASLGATLTALEAADWVANAIPIGNGADTVAQVTFAANTFPARASTGDLVAKTITDSSLAHLATGLGTASTQNTGTSGATLPFLNGNNTVSGTWLFQLDTNANYLVESKNVNTGTTSAAGFRTTSDTPTAGFAQCSYLSHAVARTVARCGQTLGGWNEILSFTGSGLLISTNGSAPMKFGTNNTLALTIATNQAATFASTVAATTFTASSSTGLKRDVENSYLGISGSLTYAGSARTEWIGVSHASLANQLHSYAATYEFKNISGTNLVTISSAGALLNIVGTNKRILTASVTTSSISDFTTGGAAIAFSRPSDGVDNVCAIFEYDGGTGGSNMALACYGDIVFAPGAASTWPSAVDKMRLSSAGILSVEKSVLVTAVHALTAVSTAGQTRTADLTNGAIQTISFSEHFTMNYTGPSGKAGRLMVYAYNSSGSSRNVTAGTGCFGTTLNTVTVAPGETTAIECFWDGTRMLVALTQKYGTGDLRPT